MITKKISVIPAKHSYDRKIKNKDKMLRVAAHCRVSTLSFANKMKAYINKQNSESIPDLKKRVLELYHQIEKWN